jgi:hypothetical protein
VAYFCVNQHVATRRPRFNLPWQVRQSGSDLRKLRDVTPPNQPGELRAAKAVNRPIYLRVSPYARLRGEDRERGLNDAAHSSESVLETRLWPKT